MSDPLSKLVELMAKLRDPESGCPWDLEQDFASIAPCTLEETYEVVEAIENKDMTALLDELGDLLFQVVFYAQLAREKGFFDLEKIAAHVTAKMTERHPHVFGGRVAHNAKEVLHNWEADKANKRAQHAEKSGNRAPSVLDGVSTALPASTRALKLQKRAARVGFDWTNPADIIDKIREETQEIETEIVNKAPVDRMEEELGDLFFVLVNLARRLHIDPETALRKTNRKFERRFRAVEERLAARGTPPPSATLDAMEKLWNEVKAEEKAS